MSAVSEVPKKMRLSLSRFHAALLSGLLISSAVNAQEGAICGNPFVNPRGWGPWDYLDPMDRANPRHIPILEKHHFGPEVRAGRRGMNGNADVLRDLRYILQACPNHHPALNVLLQYFLKTNRQVPVIDSPACYLDRARRFNPKDGNVRLLAGIYFARSGENEKALEAYREGLSLMPDSLDLNYNIGLLYAKLGRLAEANEHAVRAYQLGAQLPGLKRKLIRLDAWNPDIAEPQPAGPVAESGEESS